MFRACSLVFALAVAAASTSTSAQSSAAAPIDPVGTYTVSTASDTGQPMTGTMVITRGPDGYAGTFTSPSLPAPVVVASIASNSKQIMAALANGRGGFVLVWIDVQPDGTFKGTWHEMAPGINATGKKSK